ncbi:unnamed protein product [Agarophyton chilense]
MSSPSSHAPLPVLPPPRSVPYPSSNTRKEPVDGRSRVRDGGTSRVRDETPNFVTLVKRKSSPPRSISSFDSSDSSSEASNPSSSSLSSAQVRVGPSSPSSSSNYHSSAPSSPSNRARFSSSPSIKPPIQKHIKHSSVEKPRSPISNIRRKLSEEGNRNKTKLTVHGYPQKVLSKVNNQSSASAVEIVGRSDATIGQALEQLAILSSIPRRRGRPSKSVIEQRNRLKKLREQLDDDIQRLDATGTAHVSTATSDKTTAIAKTGQKSCKRPSRSMMRTASPRAVESPDRDANRTRKASSSTRTTTITYIDSSSPSSEDEKATRATKRQRPVSIEGKLKTTKLKRLTDIDRDGAMTPISTKKKVRAISPRKRAQKAPKTSLGGQRPNAEKGGKTVSQNDENESDNEDSDEDSDEKSDGSGDENSDETSHKEGRSKEGAEEEHTANNIRRTDESEEKGEQCCGREKQDEDAKNKKIERLQGEVDELKERLQNEMYRAVELEEALGLDVRAEVANRTEVQDMKKHIAELEGQMSSWKWKMEQKEDEVREKDAALRGLLAQVKDLEARKCEMCGRKEGHGADAQVEGKKEWMLGAEEAAEDRQEEVDELKRYATEVSGRLKRVVQANRRLQQKMLRLHRLEVGDKEAQELL